MLEVIVIIFSITISFALDEWKDSRQKKELEQIYLKGLYSDITTDVQELNEIIAETQQVIQKAKTLSEADGQTPGLANNQFLNNVRFVFKRPRFIAEDATFSDLKSTGNMQVISSFPLKNALFEYYRQYEAIVQVEAAELDATNSIIGPYLLTRLPLAGKETTASSTTLANDMAFQNMMLVRRSTREELLSDYEQSLKLGNEILAFIKPKLNK
ncbi:hypothetical protein GCM10027190_13650 [Spirosoma areae]